MAFTQQPFNQQQRAEIYAELADKISPQGAEFLMAQAPPGGWEQFATKADLIEVVAEMTARFASIEIRMEQGFAEMNSRFAEMNAEMNSRFAEMNSEMNSRFAEMNLRFAKLTEQRSRDIWAFTAAMAVMVITVVVSVFLAG